MNRETWERVRELFSQANELSGSQREAWIERTLADEPESVASELRRMFAADASGLEPASPEWVSRADGTDPMVGRELGGWILESELGRGGIGVVYAARAVTGTGRAAVKVLQPSLRGTALLIERFRREASAASKLDHPGIAKVFGLGDEGGILFLVQELVQGRSLAAWIQDLRQVDPAAASPRPDLRDPVACAELVAKVADALAAAHEQGVIHRDVKPQNVLIDVRGEPRVVDFGLAKDFEQTSLSRTGDIAGTPHYMSPEQALARRTVIDHRTDVYSLGAVLYELLTLQHPFDGTSSHEIFYKIVHQDPVPIRVRNPEVPRALALVCMQAMRRDPVQRYAKMAGFAQDLRRFAAGRSVVARPLSLPQRIRRALRKPRTLVVLAVLLVACGLVGGAGVFDAITESRAAAARPRIELALAPGVTEAEVLVWSLDGPALAAAALPIAQVSGPFELRVDAGQVRVVVRGAHGELAEFDRILAPGADERILAEPRRLEQTGSDWVLVPAGVVDVRLPLPNREPLLRAEVASFHLERACVTNEQYARFLRATGRAVPRTWPAGVLGNDGRAPRSDWSAMPACDVSWEDARDYCEWSGARLPTAFEWELAAASVLSDLERMRPEAPAPFVLGYPATAPGVSSSGERSDQLTYPAYLAAVRPAGEAEAALGADRLCHMFGNVEQWTSTPMWRPDDVRASANSGGNGSAGNGLVVLADMRVIKGGCWHASASAVRKEGTAWTSYALTRGGSSPETGFRRARSVAP